MPTTVFLCRWHGGWSEISNTAGVAAFGEIEALLSLGAQHSIEEVRRLAGAELSTTFAKMREQMTVEHAPQSIAETPYVGGYIPSDRVTADNYAGTPTLFDVVSLAVEEDEDGVLTFVPVLGDLLPGIEELQERLELDHSRPILKPSPNPTTLNRMNHRNVGYLD